MFLSKVEQKQTEWRICMEREGSQGHLSGVILFLMGGVIGVGAGLLLAPKSGKQIREQIKGLAESAKDTTEDYYERVKKTVVSALESGEGIFEEKREAITNAVKAGVEAYQKTQKQGDHVKDPAASST
jgi:gas vesicle protein